MNKKGFTLVELLAVIVILGILSAIVIPSVFTMIRNAKINSYNVLVDSFEENARLYATRHRDEVENSLDLYNYYSLTLNDLKDDDLLKTPVMDPRTDEVIDLSKKIIVTRDTDKSLSICYEDKGCYVPTLLTNEITKEGNVVTGTTEGIHYDSNKDDYYYMGSNPKNWIQFSGYYWRIVKINPDGSIKLVFEGIKNDNTITENGTVGSYQYASSNSNNYASSSIKSFLQSWYDSSIVDKNKTKVQSTEWCIGKITYDTNGTSKETFLNNECSSTSTSSPISLLSGSDYLYASADISCLTAYKTTEDYGNSCKNNNYLYKSGYNYWSITGDVTSSDVWEIKTSGSLGSPIASNNSSNVRPVINLIGSVIIDRGTGSFDNPYILKDIVNIDKEKPTITMLGTSPVDLEVGDSYSDAGATASDNKDGNLTDKIITVSNVNINEPGAYTVTYVVSDNSGNKRSVSRVVNISAKSIANAPILATGMIPIKWNGTDWVNTSASDKDWYNYDNKDWANARTSDGSMWVWIPRYVYKISSGWHTSTAGTIDVKFSKGTDDTLGGTVALVNTGNASDSNGTWTSHPAFTFGTTQLTGMWVAKFEATAAEGVVNNETGDNVTTKTPKILPNVQSWRYINIGNVYQVSKNMEINSVYGWGTTGTDIDTHLMKNNEWGAVAYLSKSIYGKNNDEIWINPADNYTTGCAGDSASSSTTSGCLRSYETPNGIKASSTGTIYGIYDLSGGSWERVSSYINNGNENLNGYGSVIISADSKYKNVYSVGGTDDQITNYGLTNTFKGDAVYETGNNINGSYSWFGDYSYMPNVSNPWFLRGGTCSVGTIAGVFTFHNTSGYQNSYIGFRPVLLVGSGL